MARIFQGSGAEDTQSQAEVDMLDYFEKLPDAYTVIHSAKWITHNAREHGSVGEADFVVAHPDHGVLIVEVKGGQIKVERNRWTSLAKSGVVYEITDPCAQADRNRWALKTWLDNDGRTKRFRYAVFPAVAFPDVGMMGDIRPDCTQDIIIDATRLDALERTLREIFAYWHKKHANMKMAGRPAVEALVDLLVPTRTLQPRIAEIFERERRKIEELTQQQFRILRMLRHQRRAAIVGGAGTGKTMLAMEKAQQLADAGFRVLFLCFNKNLADWLEKNLQNEHILVSTYHGMVGRARHWAGVSTGGGRMDWDEFTEKAPEILMDAVSIIRAPDSGAEDKLFDAIIVDEAQDFEDHWWIPLPDLLKDTEEGIFYVFFDGNQRIYAQVSSIPMQLPPFPLDENCRNTQSIHAALAPYTQTDEPTISLGPQGRPVEMIPAADDRAVRDALKRVLLRLVTKEGLSSNDIIVLTTRSEKHSQWKSDDMMGTLILTWDMETEMKNAVRVCTVYSFKGLESPVIILTEMDQGIEKIRDQLVYVGLSRACNHVVVIGDLPESQDQNAV